METSLGVWYNSPTMTNIFGTESVYVCNKCGSQDVAGEFSAYLLYNIPFNSSLDSLRDSRDLTLQDSDFCNDCEEECLVIEQKK